MIAIRACAALAALLLAAPARAADFYVDPVLGNDANTGTSPASPWRTILHAATALGQSADTIHLAPGVYSAASGEQFPIPLSGQYLRGDQGAAVTIVEGGPTILHSWMSHPHMPAYWAREVRGVTLRGATTAAVRCDSVSYVLVECTIENSAIGTWAQADTSGWQTYDLTLERVTIRGCGTGVRVGQGLDQPHVRLIGCTIAHNTGHGVHLDIAGFGDRTLTLENCTVVHNGGDGVQSSGNGGPYLTQIFLESCLIARNAGAGLRFESQQSQIFAVSSTTVAHNGGTGLRVQNDSFSTLTLDGLISHGNALEYDAVLGQFATLAASHCDIPGAPFVGTNGNIAADPLFVAPLADDFRLRFASSCVDTGNPSGPAAPDLGPYPPPIDGNLDTSELPDMGCFEFAPMELVTTGALGSPLQIHVWGAAGGTTTVHASRMAPVPPSSTPFGQLDLNPALSFVLFTSAVAPGPPVVFGRPIPNNPLLLGRTFSFQALTTSASAPLGAAWTNVASVTITP